MAVSDWTSEQLEMLAVALDLASDQEVTFVDNGVLSRVHPEHACSGRQCWIHSPSDHPLTSAPVVWDERRRTAYRVCQHAILHEDPDDQWFRRRFRTHHAGMATLPNPAADCDRCCGDVCE